IFVVFKICFHPSISLYKPSDKFCTYVRRSCTDYYEAEHLYCLNKTPEHNFTKIELTQEMKQLILDRHNELRNIVACGEPKMTNFQGEIFPKAARMFKLRWDDELEWSADLNAQFCESFYMCPATEHYINAEEIFSDVLGSNVFNPKTMEVYLDWFSEYLQCPVEFLENMTDISSKTITKEQKDKIASSSLRGAVFLPDSVSYFGTLVLDKATKIGCAIYDCGLNELSKHSTHVLCHYEFGARKNLPIYKSSKVGGSECEVRSKKFCCLCLDPYDEEHESQSVCFKSNMTLPEFSSNYEPSENFCSLIEKTCRFYDMEHLHCRTIKESILDQQNELRNILACGHPNLTNMAGEIFPRAAKMWKLEWDTELEWSADLNARSCSKTYYCPATENFQDVGMNLGLIYENQLSIGIRDLTLEWWSEYLNFSTDFIEVFQKNFYVNNIPDSSIEAKLILNSSLGDNFGNLDDLDEFANFVSDRVTKVGCAFYDCGVNEDKDHFFSMSCHYNHEPKDKETIYMKSEIGDYFALFTGDRGSRIWLKH
uniref:SCP domain-containing protein n=1 Tax=Megaselia scalaris TaxID=36166 RepID=T1GTN1_MEGSC